MPQLRPGIRVINNFILQSTIYNYLSQKLFHEIKNMPLKALINRHNPAQRKG